MINRLRIQHFRNINALDAHFHPSFNIIVGPNGSGKSSILEAIYFTNYGKSYRSSHTESIIKAGESHLVLFGEFTESTSRYKKIHTIGLSKSSKETKLEIDRAPARSIVQFSRLFPIQIIEPNSYRLLSDGPDIRRRFIDWGMFHVEHSFYTIWKQYKTALKQRNALLKRGKIDEVQLRYWTDKFVLASESLNHLRINYLNELENHTLTYLKMYAHDVYTDLKISLHQGWDTKHSLKDVLANSLERDLNNRFTSYGAHRADIKIKVRGINAQEYLSRGQQKLIVIALKLAQLQIFTARGLNNFVLLFDDIDSELDEMHYRLVSKHLYEFEAQTILTSTDNSIISVLPKQTQGKMFHVEHGAITRSVNLENKLDDQ